MMLSILVNGSPLEKRVIWPVPVLAAASAGLGFVLFIAAIWLEPDVDNLMKLVLSALVVGGGGTLAGLLQLFPLRTVHELLRRANQAVIALLVFSTVTWIWLEIDQGWFARYVGVLSVLVAAMTLALPALSKFLPPETTPSTGHAAVRFCPSCGQPLARDRDDVQAQTECKQCGVHFVVSVEPLSATAV
jgi:hypothetical protein